MAAIIPLPATLQDIEKSLKQQDVNGTDGIFLGCTESAGTKIITVFVDESRLLCAARATGQSADMLLAATQEAAAQIIKGSENSRYHKHTLQILPCIPG
jgi:hypothetical protein